MQGQFRWLGLLINSKNWQITFNFLPLSLIFDNKNWFQIFTRNECILNFCNQTTFTKFSSLNFLENLFILASTFLANLLQIFEIKKMQLVNKKSVSDLQTHKANDIKFLTYNEGCPFFVERCIMQLINYNRLIIIVTIIIN